MTKTRKIRKPVFYVGLFFAIFLPLGASSCNGTDAAKGQRDTGPAKAIINMPDHFNNVAFKCRNGKGIYVTNNNGNGGTGSTLFVLANDPECAPGETTR